MANGNNFKVVKTLVSFGSPLQAVIIAQTESVIDTTKNIVDTTKNLFAYKTGKSRNSVMAKFKDGTQYGFNDSTGEKSRFPLRSIPRKPFSAYFGSAQQADSAEDIYPVYLEFGTRYMAPQPAFRPGIESEIRSGNFMNVVLKKHRETMRGKLKSKTEKRESFTI